MFQTAEFRAKHAIDQQLISKQSIRVRFPQRASHHVNEQLPEKMETRRDLRATCLTKGTFIAARTTKSPRGFSSQAENCFRTVIPSTGHCCLLFLKIYSLVLERIAN
jgi:hypothetical protein